ncbi:unnamed protein product [Mytilus edulis]|uniref:C-type lectin n=1 Tax=Mytilus edulis TaxID=6550 RepID=A0A8S3UMG2_MYTED|nr:unnamed protein product [Mytilus edulis]
MFGPGFVNKGKCCGNRPCCVFECEDLQIEYGKADLNGTGVGSSATFSCQAGYRLLGNKLLTCTRNGWSEYIPICFASGTTVVTRFGGSRYKFLPGLIDWSTAEGYCKVQGGNLTTIETKEENDFLRSVATLIKTTGEINPNQWWIGLTDKKTEGSFEWISGHQLSYTDWYQGGSRQPDNIDSRGGTLNADCASLSPNYSFQWVDEACHQLLNAFCEIWSVFIHMPK